MRLVDLDRDLSAMFPSGGQRDSEYLYARMAEVTYGALRAGPGARVLDTAAGLGQDSRALAARGIYTVNAEPSRIMAGLEKMVADERGWKDKGELVSRVRSWAEALPFASGAFHASFCKGSLDHFDDPCTCIREMARVTRSDGRVVLAVANMDSLGCRISRWLDRFGERGRVRSPGRRHYDAPADHLTRYQARLLREHAGRHIHIEEWTGVSLLWGTRGWARLLRALPERAALFLLRTSDRIARQFPSLADLIVVAGRPREPAGER